MVVRIEAILKGVVQGIGLRPMIYRLAIQHSLTGFVENKEGYVLCHWQGLEQDIQDGISQLHTFLQSFGKYQLSTNNIALEPAETCFRISSSQGGNQVFGGIAPDLASCENCLNEYYSPLSRRYQYPFISCAQCGPRFSITAKSPYTRRNTSMSEFPLCEECLQEFNDPQNRRFHAETICCPRCGPQYTFYDHVDCLATQTKALNEAAQKLQSGAILAIKGVGGFHLVCMADNDKAIKQLRIKKNRPHKPFAVIVNSKMMAQNLCQLSYEEEQALMSPYSPIVLAKRQQNSGIHALVAPRLSTLGIMMAYTPLHHQLIKMLNTPLIATSANASNEPIIYENQDAFKKLSNIADYFLMHDRKIVHPVEDSIVQFHSGKIQMIRRARGFIPFSLPITPVSQPIIGLGSQLKNNTVIAIANECHIGPYLGNLDSVHAQTRYQQELATYFNEHPNSLCVGDNHPNDTAVILTKALNKPVNTILHHHAHLLSVAAEHQCHSSFLGFAWDGIGSGEQHELWGAECFVYHNKCFEHVATLAPLILLGKDKAMQEPRRIAFAMLHELSNPDHQFKKQFICQHFSQAETLLFEQMFYNPRLNQSISSMGRLFDAIAILLGGPSILDFEGQGAIYLEELSQVDEQHSGYEVNISQGTLHTIQWKPLMEHIIIDIEKGVPYSSIAYQFHCWCAKIIEALARHTSNHLLLLSGGVFQNRLLCRLIHSRIQKETTILMNQEIPPNDSGLAVGQVASIHYLKQQENVCA